MIQQYRQSGLRYSVANKYIGGGVFVPTNIDGCVLLIESDVGVTVDGTTIQSWTDQTGLHNFIRAGYDTDVTLVPNAQNGYPAVKSTDNANLPLYTGQFDLGDCTIFLVGSNGESLGENGAGFGIGVGGDSFGTQNTYLRVYMNAIGAAEEGYDFSAYQILACTRQGLAVDVYLNGSSLIGLTGEWDPEWLWRFSKLMYVGDTGQTGGNLLAAAMYNSVLSNTNRILVENYLNDKYALY